MGTWPWAKKEDGLKPKGTSRLWGRTGLTNLREERRRKCLECCRQREEQPGRHWRTQEDWLRQVPEGLGSYSNNYGEPLREFKLEKSRVCFIYVEAHFGWLNQENKAIWTSVSSVLYCSIQIEWAGWLYWCGSHGKWKWPKAWSSGVWGSNSWQL